MGPPHSASTPSHRARFRPRAPGEKLAPIPKANVGAASSEQVPLGRYGRMPELCNLLTSLQSDGCDYITGVNIAIDGGQHLAAPSTLRRAGKLTPDDWAQAKKALARAGRSGEGAAVVRAN